ncbi:unnamed protein product [Alternaria alternata]
MAEPSVRNEQYVARNLCPYDVISKNPSEKQLEVIQERLRAIEGDLKVIAHKSSDNDDIRSSTTSTTNQETSRPLTPFEGESSFNKETLEASRAASSILRTNPDPEVRSALSSLHNNLVAIEISEQQDNTDHHNKGIQRKVSLLPADVVIAVVKKAKGCPGDSRPQQALTVTSDTTIICSLK